MLGEVALELATFVVFAVIIPAAGYYVWLITLRLWRAR